MDIDEIRHCKVFLLAAPCFKVILIQKNVFLPKKKVFSGLFGYAFLFAVGHGGLRGHSVVNVILYYRVRLKTAVLRYGYHRKRRAYFAVYDTASYDRNTVHTKWVIYGPYTVVILSITIGYVIVNVRIRSS